MKEDLDGLKAIDTSRRELRSFLENPFQGSCQAIVLQNSGIRLKLSGVIDEELFFSSFRQFLDGVDETYRESVKSKSISSFESRSPLQVIAKFKAPESFKGKVLSVDLVPFSDESGETGFRGMFAEVSPVDYAIGMLKQSEDDLISLLSNVPDMIYKINREARFLSLYSLKKDSSFGTQEFVGKTADNIFEESLAKRIKSGLAATFETGLPSTMLHRFSVGGWDMAYDIRVSKVNDNEAVLFLRDVTELSFQKETKSDMRKKQAQRAGKVAGYLAHEISSPIQVIKGYLSILEAQMESSNEVTDKMRSSIRKMERACRHTEEVISSIRTMARDGSGEPNVEINLDSIMEEVSLITESLRSEFGHTLEWKIDLRKNWYAKKTPLIQAVVNLIQNGFEAIGRGKKGTVRVEVSEAPEKQDVCLKVIDTGPGFSEVNKGELIELFATTKSNEGGLGIGLDVVKSFVDSHKGRVDFLRVGNETVVEICMPLDPRLRSR